MQMNLDAVGSHYDHHFQPVPFTAGITRAIERSKVKDPS